MKTSILNETIIFLAYVVNKFDYYVFLFTDLNGFDIDILKFVNIICVIYLYI